MTSPMELRHLRYFLTVGETLSFTRAAAKLRIAQPALSRQVRDLEDEIGVDLFKRSPRGVTLTAEGKLYLEEARALLRQADESVARVRALARGEYGEVHVGYSPTPSIELLPPALAAFQKTTPGVKVILHDLSSAELHAGLLDGSLQMCVTTHVGNEAPAGFNFEELCRYRYVVAMSPAHPFARRRALALEDVATQTLVGMRRRDYPDYYQVYERLVATLKSRPKVSIECDGAATMLTELETGNCISVVSESFRHVAGRRLVFRPLTGVLESQIVGILTSKGGDITPAGEKLCDMLRKVAKR